MRSVGGGVLEDMLRSIRADATPSAAAPAAARRILKRRVGAAEREEHSARLRGAGRPKLGKALFM
jgi:hypothetical protein